MATATKPKIKLSSVKVLKKTHLTVTYVREEKTDDGTREIEITETDKKTEVHQDLKNRFQDMAVHLAILTGYIKPDKNLDKVKNEKDVESFHVSSYSVSGEDVDTGFVLSGHKILPNKKAVILNAPFTRFDENEKTAYKFMEELKEAFHALEEEVEKFLFENKRAPDQQTKIPGFAEDTKQIPEMAN